MLVSANKAEGSDIMDMNERKIRILEAIIHDYIKTGDPVGSRTISKRYELGVSSATIRNEMSDLEELGFIIQPHASAGRVPSDRGYRLYVDHFMKCPELTPDVEQVIVKMLGDRIRKVDTLLDETARLISMMTNYATIASTPSITETKIKHLQLVPVDEKSVAFVIVTDTNFVKHHVIRTIRPLDMGLCLTMSDILNQNLKGISLSDLTPEKMNLLKECLPEQKEIIIDLLQAIMTTLEQENTPTIFTRGLNNILGFQEFNDVEKARKLFKLLEEKPYLRKLLRPSQENEITISIGEENALEPMKKCSVITSSYHIGNYNLGTIGIIGPTRMNYGEVVSLIEHISHHISKLLEDFNDS